MKIDLFPFLVYTVLKFWFCMFSAYNGTSDDLSAFLKDLFFFYKTSF